MTKNKSTSCWASSRWSICVACLVNRRGQGYPGMHGALDNKLIVMASSCQFHKTACLLPEFTSFLDRKHFRVEIFLFV